MIYDRQHEAGGGHATHAVGIMKLVEDTQHAVGIIKVHCNNESLSPVICILCYSVSIAAHCMHQGKLML